MTTGQKLLNLKYEGLKLHIDDNRGAKIAIKPRFIG
jgi:hypothetical protein